MLLCCTCLRFCTLHDKITFIAFLLWRLFPCTCARIINSLCLSVWFICETLARGILPLGAVTRARVTITQRLNFFCSNIIHISLGNKAYQRIASFACLACCHLQGFFTFSMPTLSFLRFQGISHVNIVFTPYTVQLGSLSKTHPHFILNPLLHYFLINEPRR